VRLLTLTFFLLFTQSSIGDETKLDNDSAWFLNDNGYVTNRNTSEIRFESINQEINYNLEKYFNYTKRKSFVTIRRSSGVNVGSSCNESGEMDGQSFFPLTESHVGLRVCMSFKLKEEKATEVLLMKLNCKPRPEFVAFFKLDPKKNVTQLGVSFNESCFSEPITMLLYIKTTNNSIYGASGIFISGREPHHY